MGRERPCRPTGPRRSVLRSPRSERPHPRHCSPPPRRGAVLPASHRCPAQASAEALRPAGRGRPRRCGSAAPPGRRTHRASGCPAGAPRTPGSPSRHRSCPACPTTWVAFGHFDEAAVPADLGQHLGRVHRRRPRVEFTAQHQHRQRGRERQASRWGSAAGRPSGGATAGNRSAPPCSRPGRATRRS